MSIQVLTGRLKCGAVRLLCGKVDALLLLCRPQRLPIASIQDIGIRLRVGQVLLIGKVRLGNAGSVATKGTSLDRLPLEAGRLLPLLPGFHVPDIDILAVYPSRRHLSAKVRAMIDFLAEEFSGVPPWDRS